MNMQRFSPVFVLAAGLVLALLWVCAIKPQPVRADTLCVTENGDGGCYASVQDAVDAAAAGDTIRVAQGTYTEAVVIAPKSLTLEGGWNTDFTARDWDAYPTTINANGTGSVIQTLVPSVDLPITITIEGFTLIHGDDTSDLGWGGGLKLMDNYAEDNYYFVVRHNVITNNYACRDASCQGYGGGILVYGGSALIENNFIGNNIASEVAHLVARGGGICIHGYADAEIISNTIIANTAAFSVVADVSGQGGGVDLQYAGDAILRDNVIELNVAAVDAPGYGGGVYASGDLLDNLIADNRASLNGVGYGGGVYAYHVGEFTDNLVDENRASLTADGSGGGMYVHYLQSARENVIRNNVAGRGGGVYYGVYAGHQEFIRNQVSGNQATGDSDVYDGGGGIASQADQLRIAQNEIISNTGYYGSGVLVTAGEHYTISDNYIARNGVADTLVAGGGIAVYTATGMIVNNQIMENLAVIGGGIYLLGRASPVLDRNIIADNFAAGFLGAGGGILINVQAGTTVTLTNHIIARNGAGESGYGGGVFCWEGNCRLINNTLVENNRGTYQEGIVLGNGTSTGEHLLRNNIFFGHSTGVHLRSGTVDLDYNDYYSNTLDLDGTTAGSDDLTDAPGFVDHAGGDYHLMLNSPLIDQGDPLLYVDHDFEGDARPRGAAADVGADEAYRTETYVSSLIGNDTTGDGSPSLPYATITKGLEQTQVGGSVYVGRGNYTELITITYNANLLGGFSETNWTRNILLNPTVMDAEGAGTTVKIMGDDVNASLDGFAITGGEADLFGLGGGILVGDGAVAAITHNVIYGNHAQNAGGGVVIWGNTYEQSVVEANVIYSNTADGEFLFSALNKELPAGLQQGPEPGGGLMVFAPARVVNNLIYGNRSGYGGDGIGVGWSEGGNIQILHNTVLNNAEEGIYVIEDSNDVEIQNNLIVGHAIGITATVQIPWDYNGFYSNIQNYAPGLVAGAHDVVADPLFVDPENSDYHLRADSPMAGAGGDFGVPADFDGEERPLPASTLPDIGADEVDQNDVVIENILYLPLVVR